MKRLLLSLVMLSGLLLAQNADLILYDIDDVTEDIRQYYFEQDSTFSVYTQQSVDSNLFNKGHLGIALLQLGYAGLDVDSLLRDLAQSYGAFEENLYTLLMESQPLLAPYINHLDSLANDSAYTEAFNRDSLFVILDYLIEFLESEDRLMLEKNWNEFVDYTDSIATETGYIFDDFGYTMAGELDAFFSHLDTVFWNSADFGFTLYWISTDSIFTASSGDGETLLDTVVQVDTTVFGFDRQSFNRMESFTDYMESFAEHAGKGMEQMVMIRMNGSGDVQVAIDDFIAAEENLYLALDSLQIIFTEQPFAPFEIDTSGIGEMQAVLTEIDSMLYGKTYILEERYPEPDFIIRPVGILENLPFGLFQVYLDMYLAPDLTSYTFGNIFPNGVPGIEQLAYDMVFNKTETRDRLDTYYGFKLVEFENRLISDPDNADAHAGIAMITLFKTVDEMGQKMDDVGRFLESGRIDSLFYFLDSGELDYRVEFADITSHLTFLAQDTTGTVFTLLINDGQYSFTTLPPDYDDAIQSGDEYLPLYITPRTAQAMITGYWTFSLAIHQFGQAVDTMMADIGQYMNIHLNPEYLDFSDVQTPLEFIQVLEAANPNFMAMTDYGKDQMSQMGVEIGYNLQEASVTMDSMMAFATKFSPHYAYFGGDSAAMMVMMETMDDMVKMLSDDFNIPEQTSYFEDERVDLSAWFDHPPDNFLTLWKNYLTGVDSTLGGLFPDRGTVEIIAGDDQAVPEKFQLYPVYPNPFNPVAQLSFDLPEARHVQLEIYNLNGQRIATLIDHYLPAGRQQVFWNAGELPSGVYLAVLQSAHKKIVRKMTLLK